MSFLLLMISGLPLADSLQSFLSKHNGNRLMESSFGCPSSYASYNISCYKYFPEAVPWEVAKQSCADEQARLVDIGSAEENDFLSTTFNGHFWLGASDISSEGVYSWEDGEPLVYSNWNQTQPKSDLPSEDCVDMMTSGYWEVSNCLNALPYACEYNVNSISDDDEGIDDGTFLFYNIIIRRVVIFTLILMLLVTLVYNIWMHKFRTDISTKLRQPNTGLSNDPRQLGITESIVGIDWWSYGAHSLVCIGAVANILTGVDFLLIGFVTQGYMILLGTIVDCLECIFLLVAMFRPCGIQLVQETSLPPLPYSDRLYLQPLWAFTVLLMILHTGGMKFFPWPETPTSRALRGYPTLWAFNFATWTTAIKLLWSVVAIVSTFQMNVYCIVSLTIGFVLLFKTGSSVIFVMYFLNINEMGELRQSLSPRFYESEGDIESVKLDRWSKSTTQEHAEPSEDFVFNAVYSFEPSGK